VDTGKIEAMVTPSLEAMGYRLVRVAVTGGRRTQVLQVMAERIDDKPMSVDDCTEDTHTVSALLDVEDPIEHAYMLEVSSPGIDRPLVRREDYERFRGHEAKLELATPIDGRRRFHGKLLGIEADRIRLNLGSEVVELPFARVQRAKLVLTDELLATRQPRA
jgi:ribosome maturation factor RimP